MPTTAPPGYDWAAYLDALVSEHGTLTALAETLAPTTPASTERALRRLRARGTRDGGQWGQRLLRRFGLPGEVLRRLAWMGAYHSRFTDLPVSVCADLIRAWDHPPVTAAPEARVWLALARASVAQRAHDTGAMAAATAEARRDEAHAPPEARIERRLADDFVATKARERDLTLLGEVEAALPLVADPDTAAVLRARWVDHHAFRRNASGDHAGAEALYRSLPEIGPPFARARRCNGLAYAAWRSGRADEALAHAADAARHAGDGGHVRLRAMALLMVLRIRPGDQHAQSRVAAMAELLDDETLRVRLARARP